MSLLMDALRRAEEAKRLAGPAGKPDAPSPLELTLDPLEPTRPASRPLPPHARRPDPFDTETSLETGPTPARRSFPLPGEMPADSSSGDAGQRSAAKNLFAAKQASRSSRRSLWIFLGLGGLATLAIGGYFWWQLQTLSGGALARPPVAALPASQTPAPLVPAVQRPAPPLPAPLVAAPVESPQPATAVRTPAAAPRAGLPQREFAGVPGGSASGVFRPGGGREKQQQALDLAYQAWQADRLDDARHGYEQVLRSDARNADALLGLAAIAVRQGQPERAHDLYQQVLESDPNDVTAQAALINLRGQGDAGQSESRLKTLLASQADSSAVPFALGNVYARQGRWSEAQQAYFQAYALEPDNADLLFNLAVSLDHLRQHKLAVQYYRMALSAAETRRGAFDRNAAGKRILELQP
ncbi:MAG: tetratricopeptide repeat protein [Candidatus Accumulibacter sp.]|jgi:tetratricopeptide (TPR) repeat protein|uniref:tetratricopeptide repeat protein n=1 Tax=Accumulibacter sp. TaxID=2053492 RepID=UPI00258AD835|nr:tetratricopeptide repeat protein [Accumulibacter sp.]MBK8115989.1 tetratricopeptide repeat protein [Accumulibacter sp.]